MLPAGRRCGHFLLRSGVAICRRILWTPSNPVDLKHVTGAVSLVFGVPLSGRVDVRIASMGADAGSVTGGTG